MSIIKYNAKKEEGIHLAVCKYLKLQYPNVIFRTDFAAGMKMSIGQAMKQKAMQSERAYPDLFIAEARGGHGGLFLELKKDNSIYKKDGTLRSDPHLQEQKNTITRLKIRGYWAEFACGFEEAKAIIDMYMNLRCG
jgi:hypothetical protein